MNLFLFEQTGHYCLQMYEHLTLSEEGFERSRRGAEAGACFSTWSCCLSVKTSPVRMSFSRLSLSRRVRSLWTSSWAWVCSRSNLHATKSPHHQIMDLMVGLGLVQVKPAYHQTMAYTNTTEMSMWFIDRVVKAGTTPQHQLRHRRTTYMSVWSPLQTVKLSDYQDRVSELLFHAQTQIPYLNSTLSGVSKE